MKSQKGVMITGRGSGKMLPALHAMYKIMSDAESIVQKCIVARPIGGASLNGHEYLLDNPDGKYMVFENKPEALEFLRTEAFPGATDEELNGYYTFYNYEKALEGVFVEVV